jgi:hypothetical protein
MRRSEVKILIFLIRDKKPYLVDLGILGERFALLQAKFSIQSLGKKEHHYYALIE